VLFFHNRHQRAEKRSLVPWDMAGRHDPVQQFTQQNSRIVEIQGLIEIPDEQKPLVLGSLFRTITDFCSRG
jgi:hypothetical protein